MPETPAVSDSILLSTKKVLHVAPEYTAFDIDILMHINSVMSTLEQLGIGPEGGFYVAGPEQVWEDLLGDDRRLSAVRSYVFLRVRLLFDPPNTSFAINSLEQQAKELEWRLQVVVDPPVVQFDPSVLKGSA